MLQKFLALDYKAKNQIDKRTKQTTHWMTELQLKLFAFQKEGCAQLTNVFVVAEVLYH